MDHITMNFDRKFYQRNEVVKDCNVKPTIPNFVFQISSAHFAFGLISKVSQFLVHMKDIYICVCAHVYI